MSRSRLIRACREMMLRQCGRRNAPKAVMEDAESVLDQDVLTIGFARRFATYKRATLLLQDPDRLEAILTSKKHPVQIIFAGKAHPKDNEGKELIRRVVQFSMRPAIRQKVLFLEDYDMHLARLMLQGVDVWLNTPRRPFEACGTSGMKAAINGGLNVSILDGWWAEGYCEATGWRIGNGEEHGEPAYRDAVESQALYNVLENDVIPSFYERRNGDAPGRWIQMMKSAMKMALRDFCSMRMMSQYETNYYLKAAHRYKALIADDAQEGHSLAAQHERLRSLWTGVRIEAPVREQAKSFRVGDSFRLTCRVHLGGLSPEEVEVELYYGHLHDVDRISQGHSQPMSVAQDLGNGDYSYACSISCRLPGRFGLTARVTPRGDKRLKFTPGLLTWA
jgi:starch phosphorylase